MQKINIETSVISYYVSPRSENIRIAGHQISTLNLWSELTNYRVFVSDTVVEEISKGNDNQIKLRLEAIKNFQILEIDTKTKELAKILLLEKVIPEKCPEDALHIAVAAVNNMDFIITWNFKHINNPFMKNEIRTVINKRELKCPIICSPEEILEGEKNE